MATNHTTNYQLNLWEPQDSFVREEFNENTRKIDTTLRGAYPVLLKSWTSTQAAQDLEVDISGIEWQKYAWVVIEINLPKNCTFYVNFNDNATCFYPNETSTGVAAADARRATRYYRMICPVFYQKKRPLYALSLGSDLCLSITNNHCQYLTKLTLKCYEMSSTSAQFPAGVQVQIWGIQ